MNLTQYLSEKANEEKTIASGKYRMKTAGLSGCFLLLRKDLVTLMRESLS